MGKKNDNTLVKNASFLMIAALISKIIGMLYKSPLSNTLGNNSMGLFNYAQNVYFILLMIASFSIPQAVSKIMAEKLAFKRYRDAQKVFHCALLYVIIMGGVVALFCLFGSSILVPESMSGARLANAGTNHFPVRNSWYLPRLFSGISKHAPYLIVPDCGTVFCSGFCNPDVYCHAE